MKFPVFDLHCDTALLLLGKDRNTLGKLDKNELHIDLERGATLPGYAQCFAVFTTPTMRCPEGVSVIGMFERELAAIMNQVEANADKIRIAYSADEIAENRKQGIMSAVLTIEGTAGFDYNIEMLGDLFNIGFRITTLSWNEQNPLTGSCKTGGGLTELGREYVRRAQKVGMVVDVSHISDEGFWDIMDITERPVVATHSNSRSVCPNSRNLTDNMFREICRSGGVVGFNLYKGFVGGTGTLEAACSHFLHFMSLDPDGKHIALGGDMDGCDPLIDGICGVQDYPKLAQALLDHGFDQDTVEDIFWNNAMGVIENAVRNHSQPQ